VGRPGGEEESPPLTNCAVRGTDAAPAWSPMNVRTLGPVAAVADANAPSRSPLSLNHALVTCVDAMSEGGGARYSTGSPYPYPRTSPPHARDIIPANPVMHVQIDPGLTCPAFRATIPGR